MTHTTSSKQSLREKFGKLGGWITALLLVAPLLAGSVGVDAEDVVARVWVGPPEARREMGGKVEIWAYHPLEGVAIVRLRRRDLERLRLEGLRVELDSSRTELLHRPHQPLPGQEAGIPGSPCFRRVEETYRDLAALAERRPELARWVDIGDSREKVDGPGAGYDLRALVLESPRRTGPKAPLLLVAAMHAREYATAELATRFAEWLVEGYDIDPERTWVLDHSTISIVPYLNPDGRKLAERGLLWRKNTDEGECPDRSSGVDLNRNGRYFFGGTGSSGSECSTIYRGASVASEPETQAIEEALAALFPDQRGPDPDDAAADTATGAFVSLHSFGREVLYPWEGTFGSSVPAAPNQDGLRTLGRKVGYFNGYTVCQDCVSPASGTAVDLAYGEYGVAALTLEIGDNFFEDCSVFEEDILPSNLPALLYLAKAARRPYQAPDGPDVVAVSVDLAGQTANFTAKVDGTRYDSGGWPPTDPNEPPRPVSGVYLSVGEPPWAGGIPRRMSALDGSFGEPTEVAIGTLDRTSLGPGKHAIFVWAQGPEHAGVPTAVWVDGLADDPSATPPAR